MARSSSQAPAEQLSLIGEDLLSSNLLTENILTQIARLPSDWRATLESPDLKNILATLAKWLDKECQDGASIYPTAPFRAMELLPLQKVSVVILGQDPYHGPNQAQGLSFSVPDTCPAPPSLRNIFKELELEYSDSSVPPSHDLSNWGRQGVLLLNTSLTVEDGLPASHAKRGWEQVTDALLMSLAQQSTRPIAYMLWGAHAQAKEALIQQHSQQPYLILKANHPSPLAARRPPVPFIGCGHFQQANAWLQEQGVVPIQWLSTGP